MGADPAHGARLYVYVGGLVAHVVEFSRSVDGGSIATLSCRATASGHGMARGDRFVLHHAMGVWRGALLPHGATVRFAIGSRAPEKFEYSDASLGPLLRRACAPCARPRGRSV